MSSEEEFNKALVRRFLEAHAKGDLNTMEEMLAPDFVDHNLLPGQRPGREGYLRAHTEHHAAYSHTRYVIDKQLAEGDEVVTTFAASAIHDRGEWMGLVPTGKEFKALLILIHRIVGGKITDEWTQGSGLAEHTQQRLDQELRERERIEQELSTTVVDHPTARLYVCSDTAWLRIDGGDATPTMRLLPPSAKAAF